MYEGADRNVPVAIIRCTPDSDYCLIKHQFVAFHSELMCAGNEINRVIVGKALRDSGSEEVSRATRGDSPSVRCFYISYEQENEICEFSVWHKCRG